MKTSGYDVLDGAPAVRGNFCGRLVMDAIEFMDCGTHVIVVGKLAAQYGGSGTPDDIFILSRCDKGTRAENAPTYRK